MATISNMFSTGVLTLRDTSGNAYPCGTLQDVGIDFSSSVKELRGANKWPVAVALAGQKISVKASFANISGAMLQAVFGGTSASGMTIIGSVAKTAAASTFTIATTDYSSPAGWAWGTDLGVVYAATGQPLKYNAGTLAAGQYQNTAGVYTLHSSDATANVVVSHTYAVTAGETITGSNSAMGLATTFGAYVYNSFTDAGGVNRKMGFYFPAVIAPKLSIAMKNEDFTSQNLELEVMQDSAGKTYYFYQG
ncbi:MAG: hypothetical protein RJA59_1170 [Pseudomonadota bacterium]